MKLFQQEKNDSLVAEAAMRLILLQPKTTLPYSQDYFELLTSSATHKKDWPLLVQSYYTKGRSLYLDREYGDALPYYLALDSIAKRHRVKNEIVVRSIIDRGEISRMSFTHEGVNTAHEIFLEALALAEEIESQEEIHHSYMRLADITEMRDLFDECKRYTDLAFAYYTQVDNVAYVSRIYRIYANYYSAIGELDNAEKAKIDGIQYLRSKNTPEELASALISYGDFLLVKRKDPKKAITQFEEAKTIYDAIGHAPDDRYMFLTEGLAICYANTNDFERSHEYYRQTYELKKELVKKANNDLTRRLETKYQTRQKEQEIALLSSQQQLAAQQKKNERIILLSAVGISSLAGIFFFFQYRNRQKTNKKLKELDTAKSTFFANISHEFRTPLTLIKGPLEDQLNTANLPDRQRKNLTHAYQNTQRLEQLVEQLLALSKLESGHLKLHVQPGNFEQFLSAQITAFSFHCEEKHIDCNIQVKENEDGALDWFDRDALEKVLFNLMGNAVKYTPEQGHIELAGARTGDYFDLRITNSRNYLTPQQQSDIFKRFYQTNDLNAGTGIGLALTKELIELHKGTIRVESEKTGTTSFILRIPVAKNMYTPSEILEETLQDLKTDQVFHSSQPSETIGIISEEAPQLLIIDDTEEILEYIRSIFEGTYIVHTAKDGQTGYEKAIATIPDIIISDVMMPQQDGFTLTQRLKENELTSHIPIALLTAKTQDKDKLEGLQKGADAYVTKPFSSQFLRATLANLLENRKKLQKRFAQEVILLPKDIQLTSADEQFLDRLQKVMDTHLVQSNFTVDTFSMEMGVSRMQLHRKLKALTGQSASEFLRSQRLKLAAQLLRSGKSTISEVGYSVGFNDPSYFTKCFKKEFGCAPLDYISKKSGT